MELKLDLKLAYRKRIGIELKSRNWIITGRQSCMQYDR